MNIQSPTTADEKVWACEVQASAAHAGDVMPVTRELIETLARALCEMRLRVEGITNAEELQASVEALWIRCCDEARVAITVIARHMRNASIE